MYGVKKEIGAQTGHDAASWRTAGTLKFAVKPTQRLNYALWAVFQDCTLHCMASVRKALRPLPRPTSQNCAFYMGSFGYFQHFRGSYAAILHNFSLSSMLKCCFQIAKKSTCGPKHG